ncbi:MAG: VanW family protein [Firmicutes bacterium]|nr:VanW family protein [Bacillota bacterium]
MIRRTDSRSSGRDNRRDNGYLRAAALAAAVFTAGMSLFFYALPAFAESRNFARAAAIQERSETAEDMVERLLSPSSVNILTQGMTQQDARIFEPVILSSYTSSYQAFPESAVNADAACAYLNNTIVGAYQSFSYNETLGERTTERGYVEAPSITSARMERTVGGGICQVSSVLYHAALSGGMQILERHAHTLQVGYAPDGFDASVVFGHWDFRFSNPYSCPVVILAGRDPASKQLRIFLVSARQDLTQGKSYVLRSEQKDKLVYHNFIDTWEDGRRTATRDLGYNYYQGSVASARENSTRSMTVRTPLYFDKLR